MTLEEMIKTLRTYQYERIEIRNEEGNEILSCPVTSKGIVPYLECTVAQWFPHGAPNKDATFTVYVKEKEGDTE